MKLISELLGDKGQEIWSVGPHATVYETIEIMADKGVGALVVMENEKLVGIISERDYARKVILQGRSSRDTPVVDIMTSDIIHTSPESTVDECMALMTDNKIRHLPVMTDEKLLGVISIGDLVKATIIEQKSTIEQLERYISG
ncbi:MAG: CBS domain-containing protein [Gammaproteobacteria bacterium]|nr:CBS domain-containing protein [Gammaproteobacteria bacterium]